MGFLQSVGLEYLTLSRASGTLSGGESQRIRLATQIGSSLMGVLYILDEPSIGLHQRDNDKLLATLKRLRDLGNTLIVVEHDEDTMFAADHIVDIGPGAGRNGGAVVFEGTVDELLQSEQSITGQYLSCLLYTSNGCTIFGSGNGKKLLKNREQRGIIKCQIFMKPRGNRMSEVVLRVAGEADAPAMLALYAPYVIQTTVSSEYTPPSLEEFVGRMRTYMARLPWLVCLVDGEVAGYGYASPHRTRAAYQWSVETSIYVAEEWHRHGIAGAIYAALFELLTMQGYYNIYVGITSPNERSMKFHKSMGFIISGAYQESCLLYTSLRHAAQLAQVFDLAV